MIILDKSVVLCGSFVCWDFAQLFQLIWCKRNSEVTVENNDHDIARVCVLQTEIGFDWRHVCVLRTVILNN